MAKLKIFVSSTCYDFGVHRAELRSFINLLGHDPVLSDFNDILYDPSTHTHDSCLNEIVNCDMVVLIIGSRFGGKVVPSALENIDIDYLKTTSTRSGCLEKGGKLSITQLEILKAIEQSIPVYTFVLDKVLNEHHFYEKNKHNPIVMGHITFSSIQKQDDAKYIFEFINFITHRTINNSITSFAKLDDIKDYLKEQWSHFFQRLLLEKKNTTLNINDSETELHSSIQIVEGTDGYLTLLADLIEKSEKEVLFTSTKMAGTTGVHGKLQQRIIDKSIEFKKRNPKRLHYGIIDASSVETSSGSAELRSNVDDIILRFNNELNSIKVNFFISDEEFIVLRMNQGGDKYSLLINNKHLTIIFKRYFYYLWNKSDFMSKHLKVVAIDSNDTHTIDDILKSSGYKKIHELLGFLDVLNKIDETHQSIPNRYLEKVISAKEAHFKENDTLIFDQYKNYFHNFIKDDIDMSNINDIRTAILGNKPIEYDTLSHTFFIQYFLSNYFKARHSLECLGSILKNKKIKILDIGGGGGESALAIIDHIKKNKLTIDTFDIVDRSDKQLSITKNIIISNSYNINYFALDAYEYLRQNDLDYDFIFAGNFLCEANFQAPTESLPELLNNSLNSEGHLLVVERTESAVYESIQESIFFRVIKYTYKNDRYKIPINNSSFEFIDETNNFCISEYIKK